MKFYSLDEKPGYFVRSAEVADALEDEFDRPVITSNTAAVWHCLRKMALPVRVKGFGRQLREH